MSVVREQARIAVVCALITLAGCAGGPIVEERSHRPLAPARSFVPEQRFEFDTVLADRSGERRMLCVLELGSRGLAFATFSQLGQPLFSITYGDGGLGFESGAVPERLIDARQVLADLQLGHWPDAALRESLEGTPWRLESSGHTRKLHFDGVLAVELRTEGGSQFIENRLAGYEMSMRLIER